MTARAVTRAYDEAMRPSGLKITQFVLLSALEHRRLALGHGTRRAFRAGADLADPQSAASGSRGPRRTRRLQGARLRLRRDRKGHGPRSRPPIPYWRAAQDRIEGGLGKQRWSETRDSLKALRRVARGEG